MTVHVYSPPIASIGHYELVDDELRRTAGPADEGSPPKPAPARGARPELRPQGGARSRRYHCVCARKACAGDATARPVRGASRAAGRVAMVLIGVLAVGICGAILYKAPDGSMDFRTGVWQPAFDIAHGHAPYPDAGTWRSEDGMPSIYPPLIAVLAIPLGLLPFGVASVLWAALLVGGAGAHPVGARRARLEALRAIVPAAARDRRARAGAGGDPADARGGAAVALPRSLADRGRGARRRARDQAAHVPAGHLAARDAPLPGRARHRRRSRVGSHARQLGGDRLLGACAAIPSSCRPGIAPTAAAASPSARSRSSWVPATPSRPRCVWPWRVRS